MNKIYNFLINNIDKLAHYAIGTFITTMCIIIFTLTIDMIAVIVINSLLLTFVAAMYKEGRDRAATGKPVDKWDVAATMIGAVVTLGLYFFMLFA